ELATNALVPGFEVGDRLGVVQREQRSEMLHRREARLGDGGADPLGRGVGRDEVGVLLLEGAQLPHELVVLGVGDRRIVEDVVPVVGLCDLLAQLGDPRLEFVHGATLPPGCDERTGQSSKLEKAERARSASSRDSITRTALSVSDAGSGAAGATATSAPASTPAWWIGATTTSSSIPNRFPSSTRASPSSRVSPSPATSETTT